MAKKCPVGSRKDPMTKKCINISRLIDATAKGKCPPGSKKDMSIGKCVPRSGLRPAQHSKVVRELGHHKKAVRWIAKPRLTGKERELARAFSHVQEIELTHPSKKMKVTHGNVELDEPLRTEDFNETDIDLKGDQIVHVFTKDKRTRIILPRNTKCTSKLGSHKMICKSKGSYNVQAIPGVGVARVKLSDDERIARKRERRRQRRLKRRIERQQKKGTTVEGGRLVI